VLYALLAPGPKAEVAVFAMNDNGDYLSSPPSDPGGQLATRGYRELCANSTTSRSGFFSDDDWDKLMLNVKAGIACLRSYPAVRKFLSTWAIRATQEYRYDASSIYGLDYKSSYAVELDSIEGITKPLLQMGMTSSYDFFASEIVREHAVSAGKTLAYVEGGHPRLLLRARSAPSLNRGSEVMSLVCRSHNRATCSNKERIMINVKRGVLLVRMTMAVALLLAGSLGAFAQSAEGSKPAATPLKIQFHHATISVANIQAMADWYIQKLGFSFRAGEMIAQINPMMKGTRLVISGFQLDLIQYKGSQRPKLEGGVLMQQGLAHLAFVSPDVEGTFNALRAAGVEVHANGAPGGKMRGFTFNDPKGNEIEVFLE
jgi:catechol 2,3-dioxygenase-like lactoylglutathione lyase family enzyme